MDHKKWEPKSKASREASQFNGRSFGDQPTTPAPALSSHSIANIEVTSAKQEGSGNIVEAGDTPILVTKGKEAGLEIKGLINCVGVVITFVTGDSLEVNAIVGGHFVTPTMFDKETNTFTPDGLKFIDQMKKLINGFGEKELDEAAFYYKVPREGGTSNAVEEAMLVAAAIQDELKIGGVIAQTMGNIYQSFQ